MLEQSEPADEEEGGAEGSEGEGSEEEGGESKTSKLEYDDDGIGFEAGTITHTRARARTQAHALTHNWAVAGEVDTSLIIEGPRRKRAAAAKAQQSSEWTSLLAGKLNALGDSDSDSD